MRLSASLVFASLTIIECLASADPAHPSLKKEARLAQTGRKTLNPESIRSSKAAIAAFKSDWEKRLLPSLIERDPTTAEGFKKRVERALAGGGTLLSAQRESLAQLRKSLQERLGAQPESFFLIGSPSELSGTGFCWHITIDGLLRSGLAACVNSKTGQTIALWETPGC